MIAANVAPGLTRTRFGFEGWRDHDGGAWEAQREDARAAVAAPRKLQLVGHDLDPARLDETLAHVTGHPFLTPMAESLTVERMDARQFEHRPGWNAAVISNLPYGERVGDAVEALHGDFGARVAAHTGDSACLLTGSSRLAGLLRLKGHGRARVLNGGIECQMVTAEVE